MRPLPFAIQRLTTFIMGSAAFAGLHSPRRRILFSPSGESAAPKSRIGLRRNADSLAENSGVIWALAGGRKHRKTGVVTGPDRKNGLIEKILELTFKVITNIGTASEESRTPKSLA
jgi:hypothetical protein